MAKTLRSLGALLVLAAALVGAPWLLWQVGQEILPDRVPSLANIWNTLTSRDTGTTFIGLLVIVGVIAWAIFTVCVILDIASRISGRRTSWRIPGLRLPQRLASGLISTVIAGIVVIGGHTPAMASGTPAATGHQASAAAVAPTARAAAPTAQPSLAHTKHVGQKHQPPPAAAAQVPTHRPAADPPAKQDPAAPTVTVQPGDSLWKLAQQHLGDPLRYTEIAKLNIGRPQPDGATLTSPDQWLEVGWTLVLPRDARNVQPTTARAEAAAPHRTVVVQAGDTLSAIAERELGAADRYPEIAQLNHLVDPDELAIGQKLVLPVAGHQVPNQPSAAQQAAAARQAEEQRVKKQAAIEQAQTERAAAQARAEKAAQAEKAQAQKAAAQARAERAATRRVEHERAQSSEGVSGRSSGESPGSVHPSPQAAPPPEQAAAELTPAPAITAVVGQNHVPAGSDAGSDQANPVIRVVGIGAVTASVLWAALLLHRRRQGMRRRLGQQPAPASLPAARVEREIRQQASGVDINRLERTLRTLSALTPDGQHPPNLTCARLSGAGLRMQLASAVAPPAELPVEMNGRDWWLPAEAALPDLAWTEALAPYPALASLGAADGESLLVDLEQLGAVRVSGDPLRVQHLYNHLAVELAHSTWSDGLNVTLVGWGADLVVLAPDRVSHEPELGLALTRLRNRVNRTRESERSLDTSVLAGRMGDVAGEIWSPQVLLIAPTAVQNQQHLLAELDELLADVAEHGRAAIAVIAATDQTLPSFAELHVNAAGWLRCPTVLGEQQIRAAGVDEDLLQRLVELIVATDVQRPAPPASDPEPWAAGMATSGALLEEPVAATSVDEKDPATAGAGEEVQATDPAADSAAAGPERREEGAVVALRSVTPQVAAMLESVLASDRALDADLEEWHSTETGRPKIGILGPATVRSSGTPSGRLVRCTEIAVYLALHRSVTTDKFVTDLWAEGQQPSPATRRWWLSTVRTWLGVDDQERPYLAQARRGVQELTDRLLDVELLRRLRKRGEAWAAAGDAPRAYRDLQDAMSLVRGPILDQAPPGSYAFLSNPDRGEDHLIPLWVVQIARQTVDLALQLDDLDGARDAAEKAHRVAPDEDAPLTDLVRIAQHAGRQFEAREWATKILREHYAAQYIEDIENTETMLELSRLFPDGLQAG